MVAISFCILVCTANYCWGTSTLVDVTFVRVTPSVGKTSYDSTQCYLDMIKLQKRFLYRSTYTNVIFMQFFLFLMCVYVILAEIVHMCVHKYILYTLRLSSLPLSVKVVKVKPKVNLASQPPSPLLRRFQFTYGERAPSSSPPL